MPAPDAESPPLPPPGSSAPADSNSIQPVAITVEFPDGVRVVIDANAPATLVTATLRALQ